eukprot:TRINITY_DN19692_c0_g1_i4.p1 TRINITY_DN19692_c0_g1~~TRINITY_DN19692_c0_g1_i4.p1  ORF type:complete len:228 (-),score=56.92 TRINITY_DN19692_c0_g1_i4:123-806(-)
MQNPSMLIASKAFFPIERGSAGTVQAKVLMNGQTPELMIGYVQKDEGQPWYKLHLKGISHERAQAARQAHQSVKIDPMQGRKVLTKASLFKEMFAFQYLYLQPLQVSAKRCLQLMLSTGNYVAHAGWLCSYAGSGMKRSRVEAYWRMLHNPTGVSLEDIGEIFFDQKAERYTDAGLRPVELADETAGLSLLAMKQKAVELRQACQREEDEMRTRREGGGVDLSLIHI